MAEAEPRVADNPETAYEASDWQVGILGWLALGTFVFLVMVPLLMMWVYWTTVSDVNRNVLVTPPEPRLQTNPAQDLANFLADQHSKLDSYYWVDKQSGIVHIPIGEAMKKLAKDGIPGFPKGSP